MAPAGEEEKDPAGELGIALARATMAAGTVSASSRSDLKLLNQGNDVRAPEADVLLAVEGVGGDGGGLSSRGAHCSPRSGSCALSRMAATG